MSRIPSEYTYVKTPHHPDSGQTQTPTTPFESMRGLPEPDILDLVDAGLSIIPIERGAKHPPEGFKWRRYQDAPATREQVEQWQEEYPGCNWAAVWGAVSGGVIAVDIDSPAAHVWADRQGGFRQRSPVWYQSGREGGGWQYLFKLPAELADARGVNPHKDVEIRCNGQYSILPPSIHKTGKAYQWKRFGEIPDAPQWILDHLTGVATQETVTSIAPQLPAQSRAPQQRPAQNITRTHHGRRPHDITGRNPRILKSPGYQWLWHTTFGPGHHHHPFFSMAILLRGAGLNEAEATCKLDQWRRKCTSPIYSEREAAAVIKATYANGYGVTLEGLGRAYGIHGEHMPEGAALDLVRMFPSMRVPGKRQNVPMIATVARILIALYKNHVMRPTAITHAKLAKMTRCTERQVAEVAGFLSEIGVRTTRRQGRSLRSIYNLKTLTTSPDTLIHMFVRWGGYQEDSKLVVWRWWKRLHSMLAQLLRYLADVFESFSATLAGETVDPIGQLEFASTSTRGPPE